MATLVCTLWWGEARADATPIALEWNAPPTCPSGVEIEAEVKQLVTPKGGFVGRLEAQASIERSVDGRYTLSLHTTQSGVYGERSFSGKSCRAVSDAAIVTMALSLDPNVDLPKRFQAGATEPAETAGSSDSPRATEDTPRDSAQSAPHRVGFPERLSVVKGPILMQWSLTHDTVTRTQLQLQSIVGWRWGTLPKSAGELGLGIGLRYQRLLVELEASGSPEITVYSRNQPTVGGTFFMLASQLDGCWAMLDRQLVILPCAGMSFAYVGAKGIGVEPQSTKGLYFFAPEVGLRTSLRLANDVAFSIHVDGYVPLRRPAALVLTEDEVLYRPRLFDWRLGAGVAWTVW